MKSRQGKAETELREETERNKDDIEHLEELQKAYEERCAAYDVGRCSTFTYYDANCCDCRTSGTHLPML